VHIDTRITCGFENSVSIRFCYEIMEAEKTEVLRNHDSENVRHIGRGETQHKEYKRLKLGGCQTHDRSDL